MMMINTMVKRLTYVYIREELWDSMSRLLGSICQIIMIIMMTLLIMVMMTLMIRIIETDQFAS